MKTVITFLLGAVVAAGGTYLYHKFELQKSKTLYVLKLNIKDGQRVELKDPSDAGVEAFKKLLKKIDPNGANGSMVNIRSKDDNASEVEGPTQNDMFAAPASPVGPDGSIRSTQRVATNSLDDVKEVLDSLASSSAGPVPPVETPSPTATPSP